MTRCAEVYFQRPRIFDFVIQLLPWTEARTCQVFTFNDAVEALAYDRLNSRLAITSHTGHVKLFDVDKCKSFYVVLISISSWMAVVLKPIWAINTGNDIPRAVFFFGGAKQFLLTLALESGEMCAYERRFNSTHLNDIITGVAVNHRVRM